MRFYSKNKWESSCANFLVPVLSSYSYTRRVLSYFQLLARAVMSNENNMKVGRTGGTG